jgi:hypothetical protein
MTTKGTLSRRKFASEWDEIQYLRHKVVYWLYECGERAHALKFANRLNALLRKADPDQEAILGTECRALLAEAQGDLRWAIDCREREIRQRKRLEHISADSPVKHFDGYGYSDLSDRLDQLAILYHDAGNLEKAIATLRQPEQLCQQHGLPFEGAALLQEYLAKQGRTLDGTSRRRGRETSPVRSA